ncbi:MAG: hypothetical protein ACFBZ9_08640 [Sphingomonadales bacterium]
MKTKGISVELGLVAAICAMLWGAVAFAQDEAPKDLGDTKACVQLRQIRQTHVIDDETIVFEMIGRRYYLNQLPNRCPRLGFERSFSYSTSITQLCNVDIITVIQNLGGRLVPGPACGLGMFEPITKEEFKARRKGEFKEEEAQEDAQKDATEGAS